MKKLTAAQTKSITNAKDQVKAAANVMIETPLELIKCILLKHETAVIEVMKELHDEKMRLQQQRDELLALVPQRTAGGFVAFGKYYAEQELVFAPPNDTMAKFKRKYLDQCEAAIAKVKGE